MKILLIGISGFVGRFLTQKLIDECFEVNGLDIKDCECKDKLSLFKLGDVSNIDDIKVAVKDCEMIINLAAEHHDFGVAENDFYKINCQGTENIIKAATELGIKKQVFYSTVAVYGDNIEPSNEDMEPNPVSPYGKSKLEAETLLKDWVSQDKERELLIVRPTVVFGSYNFANVYNLIDQIYKKRFLFVGKGDNIKSVAYVENLVDATLFLLKKMKPGISTYNYSDYSQRSISEIVEIVVKHLGYSYPKKLPLKLTFFAASIFDILAKISGYNFPITANRIKKFNTPTHHGSSKLREEGFIQKIDIAEGFKRMIDWYLKNNGEKK